MIIGKRRDFGGCCVVHVKKEGLGLAGGPWLTFRLMQGAQGLQDEINFNLSRSNARELAEQILTQLGTEHN